MTGTKKNKGGRPSKSGEWNVEQWEMFGRFHAAKTTIAEILGCHLETIKREFKKDESVFCAAYNKGLADTKQKLAEKQIQLALSGHAGMLIWLGKQLLGQKDKIETESEDSLDGKIVLLGFDPNAIKIPKRLKGDDDEK